MPTRMRVQICLLPLEGGGLVKGQQSGTRSLYFHFGWGSSETDFGGVLDVDGEAVVAAGLGPVGAVVTMWADAASAIEVGHAFSIRYPTRVVGYGLVLEVGPVDS